MKKWTEYEINYIKYNIKTKAIKQIAIDLGRSESSIYSKISKLNIEKNFKWTDEEINKLIELYPEDLKNLDYKLSFLKYI